MLEIRGNLGRLVNRHPSAYRAGAAWLWRLEANDQYWRATSMAQGDDRSVVACCNLFSSSRRVDLSDFRGCPFVVLNSLERHRHAIGSRE
jgi:hypothetical protein